MVKRGRPFEPGNKVGGGRPRGSRNKRGLLAQQLLDSHEEAVIRKALLLALQGDVSILRTLVGHILPRRGDPPVKTGPLPMGTVEELAQTSEAVLKRVASGQITISASTGNLCHGGSPPQGYRHGGLRCARVWGKYAVVF
jgi:hypothetical protein